MNFAKVLKRLLLIIGALFYACCALRGIVGLFGFAGYFVMRILALIFGSKNPIVGIIELIILVPLTLFLLFYSGKKVILLLMNKFDIEKLDILRKVFYIFCDFVAITGLIRHSLYVALAFNDIYLLPRYTPLVSYSILLFVFLAALSFLIYISRSYFTTPKVKNILCFTLVPILLIVGYIYSILLRYMSWFNQFGAL